MDEPQDIFNGVRLVRLGCLGVALHSITTMQVLILPLSFLVVPLFVIPIYSSPSHLGYCPLIYKRVLFIPLFSPSSSPLAPFLRLHLFSCCISLGSQSAVSFHCSAEFNLEFYFGCSSPLFLSSPSSFLSLSVLKFRSWQILYAFLLPPPSILAVLFLVFSSLNPLYFFLSRFSLSTLPEISCCLLAVLFFSLSVFFLFTYLLKCFVSYLSPSFLLSLSLRSM